MIKVGIEFSLVVFFLLMREKKTLLPLWLKNTPCDANLILTISLLILVWNRSWLSREPQECTNVFSVSIPNERTIPSAGLQQQWGKCRQHFILKLPLVKRKQVANTMKMLRTLASKFDLSFCHAYVVFTPSAIKLHQCVLASVFFFFSIRSR